MLPNLYGLLLRFRMFPIGIIADIEKAFLKVGLQVCDQDVTLSELYRVPFYW